MNYLVLETHPAYAVVLDEEGRFLKAANLSYQVGERVDRIVELRRPAGRRPALWKPLSGAAGLAACLCVVFFGWYQPNFIPYGALRIQINPDVELTLSRTDRVLGLEGLNADGRDLIEGYDYRGKDREEAAEDLVDRAIDMGYLSDGETVSITVTSADGDWQVREEREARAQLEERYGAAIVIQVGPASEEPPQTEVTVPVTPPDPAPEPAVTPAPSAPAAVPPDDGDDDDGPWVDGGREEDDALDGDDDDDDDGQGDDWDDLYDDDWYGDPAGSGHSGDGDDQDDWDDDWDDGQNDDWDDDWDDGQDDDDDDDLDDDWDDD